MITGASSGIGAATALVFADLGAKVAIGYHGNQAGAEKVREEIEKAGGTARSRFAPMCARPAEIRTMIEAVTKQLGPIDILVNNAGSLVERQRILEVTEERWNDIMALNLTSAVLCSQAVAASMIERKSGAIINIVSIAGRNGGGLGAGAYATAKGASDHAYQIAGQGTGSAWSACERRVARCDRDAVSRSIFHARR